LDFILFALKHPSIVTKRLLGKKLSQLEKNKISLEVLDKITVLCNVQKKEIGKFHTEFQKNNELTTHLTTSLNEFKNSGAFNPTFQSIIYSLIRFFKPENIVETGVANGVSSTIILTAINLNKKGKLNSIDLPVKQWENSEYRNEDKVRVKNDVGWIVPENLKNNWNLKLGSSSEELPKLLQKIGKCDIFFHDSEHSYENMFFEFKTVWPYLSKNAIIISDDVDRNDSFKDFVNLHKDDLDSFQIGQFGFAVKK
jgi:predicted O-methyltransferase YrrM